MFESEPTNVVPNPNSEIEDLAAELRELYVEHRRAHARDITGRTDSKYGSKKIARWDGGVDSFNRKHKNIWVKIAQFVSAHKLNPKEFVAAQFSAGRCPLPNMLLGQGALQKYSEWLGEKQQSVPYSLQNDLREFEFAVLQRGRWYPEKSEIQRLEEVLLDRVLTISPLFRYAMASRAGLVNVANSLRPLAYRQYLTSPQLYKEVYDDVISGLKG